MGNITGAMVFQSAIPTVVALALAGDAWRVGPDSMLAFGSAAVALVAIVAVFGPMARRHALDGRALLVGGLLYVAYVALVILSVAGVLPAP
jgi:hypothetical protein